MLPQHGLSRLVHAAARSDTRWFKNLFIRTFMAGFKPDLSDALESDPLSYETFNAFFTRALKPGARPLPLGRAWGGDDQVRGPVCVLPALEGVWGLRGAEGELLATPASPAIR